MSRTETPERETSGVRGKGRDLVERVKAYRSRVRSTRTGYVVWRTLATLFGVGIIVVGIVLLPLPGPGWLIIFFGLGVLATEYEWASRLLQFARRNVSAWTNWVAVQSRPVQAVIGLAGLIVLAGVFLLVWWIYTLR